MGGMTGASWRERLHAGSCAALYLHVPFCAAKCSYCDFASWATAPKDPLVGTYVTVLGQLCAEAAAAGLLEGCATAYVGGGTPTLAGEGLVEVVRTINAVAPQVTELTCEANPDSLTDQLLAQLPEAGCTRLSVGVQSLDDDELAALGRIHTASQARERLAAAVSTGLAVSCDLMCATPRQTDEGWQRTCSDAVNAGVGHVSVYPLQIEEGTPLGARYGDVEPAFNDPEVQAARMEQAHDLLAAAGFARYEVASYARPGQACRHNCAYWTGLPYLGIGCHASSMLTHEAYSRLREVAPRLPRLADDTSRVRLTCTDDRSRFASARSLADLSWELELLSPAQAAAEDLMLGMRLVDGLDSGLVAHAQDVLGEGPVRAALAWCEERGLVTRREGRHVPTSAGWLLGNELYGSLWDLAPGPVTQLTVPAAR